MCFYSVLKAITGSFLLANLAGMIPPIIVSKVLITTNIIAAGIGRTAIDFISTRL